jgi:hypothetical protein
MKEGHLFERCRRILVPPCELKPSWRYRQDDIDIQRYFSISYHQPTSVRYQVLGETT